MRLLFVHQNFPGQYRHVLKSLIAENRHEIVFITEHANEGLAGVKKIIYKPHREPARETHHYVRSTESAVVRAQAVARVCIDLKRQGFVPDLMIGHNGWGEIFFLKDVFPQTPLLGYFEFFYRAHGADVGFDPEYPSSSDTGPRVRMMNAGNMIGLEAADWGQTPTMWQRSRYPASYRDKLIVCHEGIDTEVVRPDADAHLRIADKQLILTRADQVITYVARNLEPHRGFHVFMRALPELLRRQPKAHVVIVGGDDVSYGARLPRGESYKKRLLAEVGNHVDMARVHFLGKVPYATFLKVLQVSSVHVYLTYPFVLSWSMLEAMAAECLLLASATPPVMEVIEHEVNGLLVDFFDREALLAGIDRSLTEAAALWPLRDAARKRVVERYDLNRICLPRHRAIIDALVAGKSPVSRSERATPAARSNVTKAVIPGMENDDASRPLTIGQG